MEVSRGKPAAQADTTNWANKSNRIAQVARLAGNMFGAELLKVGTLGFGGVCPSEGRRHIVIDSYGRFAEKFRGAFDWPTRGRNVEPDRRKRLSHNAGQRPTLQMEAEVKSGAFQ